MWTITINEDELRTAAQGADDTLKKGMEFAVARAVDQGAEIAIRAHSYKNQTTALERSTKGRMTGRFSGVVEAKAEHASYVDEGTKAHTITGNPWLIFVGKGGRQVMTHSVNHPGTAATGFMRAAEERSRRVLQEETERAAQAAANYLAR